MSFIGFFSCWDFSHMTTKIHMPCIAIASFTKCYLYIPTRFSRSYNVYKYIPSEEGHLRLEEQPYALCKKFKKLGRSGLSIITLSRLLMHCIVMLAKISSKWCMECISIRREWKGDKIYKHTIFLCSDVVFFGEK